MTPQEITYLKPLKELIEDAGAGYLAGMFETVADCMVYYNAKREKAGEGVREDMEETHFQLKLFCEVLRKMEQ